MKVLLSGHLETISFFCYFGAFIFYTSKVDNQLRYRILYGYYFVGGIVMFIAEPLEVNTFLYNFLYLLTSLALSFYFYQILQTPIKKTVALVCGFLTLIYYISNSFIFSREILFDSVGHVISSSGIVLLIFVFLHQIITNVKDEPLSYNFDFWFVCTQLFYHLGSFAIFLSYNYFTRKVLPAEFYSAKNRDILTYLWAVHNVLLFLSAVIAVVSALWIYVRKR